MAKRPPPSSRIPRVAAAREPSRPPRPHRHCTRAACARRPAAPDFDAAEAFVWRADSGALAPVAHVNRVDISLLRGVDRVRDLLVDNTRRFARALPANNALLWGARGMGKSSLVKAAHAAINREKGSKDA